MSIKIDENLIRIGKITMKYYEQLNTAELTNKDFDLWIESLEEPQRSYHKNKGLDDCRGVLNFHRFVLELKGKGMDEYLKANLTDEDYSYWIDIK